MTHKERTMSDESPIIFTDSCCTKVADLIAEENNPELKLRVFVNGGGCSGFQYGFTFDEIKNDDDCEISTTPKACTARNSSSATRTRKPPAAAVLRSRYKQPALQQTEAV